MPPQRQKHISQKVGAVVTLAGAEDAAATARDNGFQVAPTPAAPKVAAEICRKHLRERCLMPAVCWREPIGQSDPLRRAFSGKASGGVLIWIIRERPLRARRSTAAGL
jgi:hypothetical protein